MNILLIFCSVDFTWLHWCLSLIGWPRLKWVVTDSKYLTKPSKDWQPHIPTANTDPSYIEVTDLRLLNVSTSFYSYKHNFWSLKPDIYEKKSMLLVPNAGHQTGRLEEQKRSFNDKKSWFKTSKNRETVSLR